MIKSPEEKAKTLITLKAVLFGKPFFYCIYLLIFTLMFILINHIAVNVPYWDQWRTVDALIKYHENNLTFTDFWFQHNEARMFFPLLIEFGIAYLSNLNVVYEIYFSLFLILIISIILYKSFSDEFKNFKFYYLFFIPILLLLVSFRQYTNFLWGFEICIYLSILCVILSIYSLIYHNNLKGFVIAAITAFIASFSFSTGLLIFPIGALILIKLGREKNELLSWIFISVLSIILFFWNWTKPMQTPPLLNFDIINQFLYLLIVVGSPLAKDFVTAAVFGLIILILTIFTLYLVFANNLLKINYFWIFVLLYSFCCSLLNVIGRAGWGAANAFTSRYTPFSILAVISLYCLILSLFHFSSDNNNIQKMSNLLFGSISSLIIIGLILGNFQGFQEFTARNPLGIPDDNLQVNQYYLLTYQSQSDENLQFIYPHVDFLKPRIVKMEKYQLGVFRDHHPLHNWPILTSPASFSIDLINSKKVVPGSTISINKNEKNIQIDGWAIDGKDNKIAQSVYISVDEKFDIPAIYSIQRSDVADYFKNENIKNCGFQARFPTDKFNDGVHNIKLKILTNNNEIYITEPVFITIVNSTAPY
jgi:hypothetical protein